MRKGWEDEEEAEEEEGKEEEEEEDAKALLPNFRPNDRCAATASQQDRCEGRM